MIIKECRNQLKALKNVYIRIDESSNIQGVKTGRCKND